MNRNQRFLVALSNTDCDGPLLQYARHLAQCRLGREFRFVHVAMGRAEKKAAGPPSLQEELNVQLINRVEADFGSVEGVVSSCHLMSGERVDALLEFSTRSRSDIILLGHRRLRSGQRSLARRLAMISSSSVWMVPEGAPLSINSVLAPVDFSEHSRDSLAVAADIAWGARAARLMALHVYFDRSTLRFPEHVKEERQHESEAFQAFLTDALPPDYPIETRLEEGSFPSRTILRIAQEESADLVVMSTRGRSRAAAVLLGSETTQVMTEAPMAVLAVKHFGAAIGLFQALKDGHILHRPTPKSN